MKVLVKIWLVMLWTMSINADWTLGTIVNNSDLVIEKAWRYNALGTLHKLSSLSKLLSNAPLHQRTSVFVNYQIGSKGVALRCSDGHRHEVDIFLDGQPAHSVEWNRKKTSTITKFPQKCAVADGAFCARVLVQDVADGTYLASPVAQAHDGPTVFNLIISGSKGSYQTVLQEA